MEMEKTLNQETVNNAVEKAAEIAVDANKNLPVAEKTFVQRHENGIYMGVGAVATLTLAGGIYLLGKYVAPAVKSGFNAVGDAVHNMAKGKNDGDVVDSTATEIDEEDFKEEETE